MEGGSILEVQQGIYTPLTVEARDKFGNICPLSEQDVHSYSVEVTKVGQIIIKLANYSFYYLCFPRILETSFFKTTSVHVLNISYKYHYYFIPQILQYFLTFPLPKWKWCQITHPQSYAKIFFSYIERNPKLMNQKSLFSPTIFQVLLNNPLPTKNIAGNIKQPPKKIFAK